MKYHIFNAVSKLEKEVKAAYAEYDKAVENANICGDSASQKALIHNAETQLSLVKEQIKAEYETVFLKICSTLEKALHYNMGIAPSPQQLSLLQTFPMLKAPSLDTCKAIYAQLKTCPLAAEAFCDMLEERGDVDEYQGVFTDHCFSDEAITVYGALKAALSNWDQLLNRPNDSAPIDDADTCVQKISGMNEGTCRNFVNIYTQNWIRFQ